MRTPTFTNFKNYQNRISNGGDRRLRRCTLDIFNEKLYWDCQCHSIAAYLHRYLFDFDNFGSFWKLGSSAFKSIRNYKNPPISHEERAGRTFRSRQAKARRILFATGLLETVVANHGANLLSFGTSIVVLHWDFKHICSSKHLMIQWKRTSFEFEFSQSQKVKVDSVCHWPMLEIEAPDHQDDPLCFRTSFIVFSNVSERISSKTDLMV